MIMPKLTEPEVESRLAQLSDWARVGDQIVKRWRFASAVRALEFVNHAATKALELNQAPEIILSGRDVRIELATHAEGGLTDRDFELATTLDRIPVER
jgi:4a-hydroxytetrahydrobiopterin dehydratase